MNDEQLLRYSRQILLPEFGIEAQERLLGARVLIVGAGGLGSPVALYLAAAGVGTLGIVENDTVSLSNLQRQVIHDTASVGRSKLDSARETIARINPHVAVEAHALRLTPGNAAGIIEAYDVVVDGSDNFDTRYAVADACAAVGRPLVHAAVGRFDGSLTVLKPHETGADGRRNPSYRDLFPEPPPAGLVPSCAQAGVLGALTGVLGTLQALEAVKLITGIGEPLVGRLLLYDALGARFDTIRYGPSPGA